MRFQKMLLSTPNGRQYSAKRNTIAETEIMILIKFVESEKYFLLKVKSGIYPCSKNHWLLQPYQKQSILTPTNTRKL